MSYVGYDWVLLGLYWKGLCAAYISLLLGKFYGMLLSFHAHSRCPGPWEVCNLVCFCRHVCGMNVFLLIYILLYILCIFVSNRYSFLFYTAAYQVRELAEKEPENGVFKMLRSDVTRFLTTILIGTTY